MRYNTSAAMGIGKDAPRRLGRDGRPKQLGKDKGRQAGRQAGRQKGFANTTPTPAVRNSKFEPKTCPTPCPLNNPQPNPQPSNSNLQPCTRKPRLSSLEQPKLQRCTANLTLTASATTVLRANTARTTKQCTSLNPKSASPRCAARGDGRHPSEVDGFALGGAGRSEHQRRLLT